MPTNPLESGLSSCCPASLRLVSGLPDPNLPPCSKMPMLISSPKCRCQSPRQNANVNLLAKLPMSIPSPKCTTHEPLTPPFCRPRADLTKNCPTLGILRPPYLIGFDSRSAFPISARNTNIALNCILRVQQLIDQTLPDRISL